MFKYETHMHTKEGSACSSAPAADMARAHKEAGYDGIFVTDHFFNATPQFPGTFPGRSVSTGTSWDTSTPRRSATRSD